MDDVATPPRNGHARQTRNAAAAQQSKQDRLGLIVGMMGGQDMICANVAGMLEQQVVARLAGALLDARFGLFAVPRQDVMRETERLRPSRDSFGLAARIRPQ